MTIAGIPDTAGIPAIQAAYLGQVWCTTIPQGNVGDNGPNRSI